MRNGRILFGVLLGILIGAIVLCVSLWRGVQKLQAENRQLVQANSELKNKPPIVVKQRDTALLADFEKQKTELLRLRNEVAQMRAAAREAEVDRARAGVDPAATNVDAGSKERQRIPSDEWRFLGYGTPEASLISGLWAMKEGQVGALKDTFTAAERERFELQMVGKTDADIAQRFQKEYGQVTGLQVVGQHEMEGGELLLDVYLEGPGRLKKYRMSQVNGEWKAGGPVNQNLNPLDTAAAAPGAMMYYISNPELMKRYFPQMYEMMTKQKREQGAIGQGPIVSE